MFTTKLLFNLFSRVSALHKMAETLFIKLRFTACSENDKI